MLISVVVATYNRPDALAVVLRSLGKQDDHDFEVVVADDGSGAQTAQAVEQARQAMPVPLTHVWQEDTGFRLAAARNRATAQARGDYLIYLDGDCVARPHFVRAHRRLASHGWCVAGGRVLLDEELTRAVISGPDAIEDISMARVARLARRRQIDRVTSLLWLPLGPLRRLGERRWQRLRGCNFSAFRADIERVNGFDERFQGWGFEDSEFAVRLINAGVMLKNGRFATTVYHLWHREHDRTAQADNRRRLQARMQSIETRAEMGLDRYR